MQEFSEKKRKIFNLRRADNAWRGVVLFVKHDRGLNIFFACIVVALGLYIHVSSIEWMFLVFAIGTFLAAETFNTAIEIDIDLTSPEYHPYARDTKDVAAGAVLITACMAFIIGLIIFIPKIF